MTSALVQINPHFVSLQAAKVWLEQCMQLDEIKRVRRMASALEKDMQEAGIVKIYAERRLGQILGETLPHQGGRPEETVKTFDRFRLDDVSISKNESSWFQTLAAMPEGDLEAELKRYHAKHAVPKASGIATRWRREQRDEAIRTAVLYLSVSPDGSLFTNRLQVLVDKVARAEMERFGCVYADPPWPYENTASRGAAVNHYPTMPLDDIIALPIESLVAERALLWLWVTNAFLEQSFTIIEQWGFEFKATLVWNKVKADDPATGAGRQQMGTGNYLRNCHELLLLGSRGGQRTLTRDTPSVVSASRQRHSAKPEAIRDIVQRNSPVPRLELFGRVGRAGWTVFGNEEAGEPHANGWRGAQALRGVASKS